MHQIEYVLSLVWLRSQMTCVLVSRTVVHFAVLESKAQGACAVRTSKAVVETKP